MSESSSNTAEVASPALAQSVAARLAEIVRDVVVCPGSRNAPLSLAVLAQPGLRVHTRIDERSAAFLALGIARASGRPAAVITTSGTAVANCLPAMVEAAHAHVPLIMVSADRPARLVGTGASQTIVQDGIFATVAPTLSVSAADPSGLARLADEVARRWAVHLNVALDTPLVEAELPAVAAPVACSPYRPPWVDRGQVTVDLNKDTLVIAGDEAWEIPDLADVPTIAEPSAPAPYRPVHPLAAAVFARGEVSTTGASEYADYIAKTRPEQIVVVGHPTLHRPVSALLADPRIAVITLSRTDTVTDPAGTSVAQGSRVQVTGQPRKQWLRLCEAVSQVAADAVREQLENPDFGFTGLHVAAAVADGLGVGDTLVLGASNPVRDAALVGLPFDGVRTLSPRGAAGIDGTVSQAIGVALATQAMDPTVLRAPRTVALLGDVTFLHDVGGLLIGPDQVRPENLTIVVANDDGCGIFETLEAGAAGLRPYFERAFGTPHGVDLAAVCAGYGVSHEAVSSLPDLLVALARSIDEPHGLHVIEARTTRQTRRELDAALAGSLGSLGGDGV